VDALQGNTNQSDNTALGAGALNNNPGGGSNNAAIGKWAGFVVE
jgi:hypothetical protein